MDVNGNKGHMGKGAKETDESFMEFLVTNVRTGKPIDFKINRGSVKIPHGIDFNVPPNKYGVDFTERAIGRDKSYGGMNYYAAKELSVPFEYGPDVVVIAKQTTDDPAKRREKLLYTIAHEILEAELMSTGLPYRIAHMYPMEVEKGVYRWSGNQLDQL
jgi:hypothetical protein